MMEFNWKLSLLPEMMAISRLPKDAALPPWALTGSFFSVTRTAEELSVVCLRIKMPEGIRRDGGWRGLKVEGPLDFSATGILASRIEGWGYEDDEALAMALVQKAGLAAVRGSSF